MIAKTPEPPYYAVVFTSVRTGADAAAYALAAARMVELAAAQPGFLCVEHAGEDEAITVSYWTDLAAIAAWKAQGEHLAAQTAGKDRWYAAFALRIARVEKAYGFTA